MAFYVLLVLSMLGVIANCQAGEIPLNRITSRAMPGTQHFSDFLPKQANGVQASPTKADASRRRTFERIRFSLTAPSLDKQAMRGFVVAGSEIQAIAQAATWLRKQEPGVGGQLATEELHAAFFAYASAYQVVIEKVERNGNRIHISYRFKPQYTPHISAELALIALGKLTAGEYHVSASQLPMSQQYLNSGFQPVDEQLVSRLISQPFSFVVREPPVTETATDPAELSDDTIVIPLNETWGYMMPGTRDLQELDVSHMSQPFHSLCVRDGNFHVRDKNATAGPGFAVVGIGEEALVAANQKLPKGAARSNFFPAGSDLSVVFFAGGYNSFVGLQQVERHGDVIKVYYRFDRNPNPQCTWHFALIPVGKLPSGKYQVNVIEHRDPRFKEKWGVDIEETWAVDPIRVRQAISESFSFSVFDPIK